MATVFALMQPEILQKIVIGVAGAVVIKLGTMLYVYVTDLMFRKKNFTISGTWFAEFESHITNKLNIEFVRFVQSKEHVRFNLQQYTGARAGARKYCGEGILRVNSFSAVYYSAERRSPQSGAFSLTVQPADGSLSGRYAELEKDKIEQASVAYILKPLKMTWLERFKLAWGIACFKDVAEAKAAIQRG